MSEGDVAGVDVSEQSAFGVALRRARGTMSVRAAARAADISEARWRQLENGYVVVAAGTRIPANPREGTVRRVAAAVGMDLREAFERAGLPVPADVLAGPEVEVDQPSVGGGEDGPEPYLTRRRPEDPDLTDVSTDALLEEIARRARARNPDADR